MPRRHTVKKHSPYRFTGTENKKVRYGSRQAAEHAAELRMLQIPDLVLRAYKGIDGGWYLTSDK